MSIGYYSYFYLCIIYATHNIGNITGFGGDVKPLSYKIWGNSEKNL